MCPLTSEPQVLISHAPTPDTLGHRTPDPPEGLPGLCRDHLGAVLDRAETKCRAAQETADRKHTDMPLPPPVPPKVIRGEGTVLSIQPRGPCTG